MSAGGRHGRRRSRGRERGSLVFELAMLVPAAVVLAVLIKTFLAQAFYVPSGSMETTIHGAPKGGDRVVVAKLPGHFGHEPQRGQVVVFHDEMGWIQPGSVEALATSGSANPAMKGVREVLTFVGLLPANGEKDLIKRIVGVGGDVVSCQSDRMFVNGVPLDESYVHPGDIPCTRSFRVKVPEGRMFVMGDHRAASADSTFHLADAFQGTVPQSSVVGPAVAVVLPANRFHLLSVPRTFKQLALSVTG